MEDKHIIVTKISREYKAVAEFYGDRVAERSRVPLVKHIDDGLVVLNEINASLFAMRAWCLHPLFQADQDLARTVHAAGPFWEFFHPHCILLAMEYRYRANAWLSDKVFGYCDSEGRVIPSTITQSGAPTPGDLEEVHHMLIADKVQNFKDFCTHHRASHPRSAELTHYFQEWLRALDVDEDEHNKLCNAIDSA